ncbi:MAG: hypothetical protein ACRCTJ_02045 [Brevinema sp.]
MRILLIILLTVTQLFCNEHEWTKKELLSLQEKYHEYISKALTIRNSTQLLNLECDLTMYQPTSKALVLKNSAVITLPTLEFFIYANPSAPTENMTISNKVHLAKTDLSKIKVFLFLLPKLIALYQSQHNTKHYAKFLYEVESEMLLWAKNSLNTDTEKQYSLSLEYGILRNELSKINFPAEFSFYRRRILVFIDTPEGAQDEIRRLEKSLQELTKQK